MATRPHTDEELPTQLTSRIVNIISGEDLEGEEELVGVEVPETYTIVMTTESRHARFSALPGGHLKNLHQQVRRLGVPSQYHRKAEGSSLVPAFCDPLAPPISSKANEMLHNGLSKNP